VRLPYTPVRGATAGVGLPYTPVRGATAGVGLPYTPVRGATAGLTPSSSFCCLSSVHAICRVYSHGVLFLDIVDIISITSTNTETDVDQTW